MKNQKVLSMDYYDNFECIGNRCEDHCCKEWDITIDKKTYLKYKNIKKYEIKNKINEAIGRNRKSNSDFDYARIKLVDNICPMLSKDGLCEVYTNIGKESMCYTCKTYPRYYNLVNDTLEISLTLSCIEAARNILLKKEPIEFNLEVKEVKEALISKKVDTIKYKNLRVKYFNEIRTFSIWLVQNRRFDIETRLIILGLFIKSISGIKEESQLVDTMNEYYKNIENGIYDGVILALQEGNAIDAQLEFLTNIYSIMVNKKIINQRYVENFITVVENLQLDSEDPKLIKERYNTSFNEYYKPFIKNHEYIYENYLVSFMFKNLFPLGEGALLEEYINLVVNYSIIKMNVIGLCGNFKEDMDEMKVVNFIQSFSRVIEHDRFIINKVNKYLCENNQNTFAHMVILIGK